MGAKAKVALQEANHSILRITKALELTMQNFMGMAAQKKGKKDTIELIDKHVKKKHAGQTDLNALVKIDPTIKEMLTGVEKCRERIGKFRFDCRAQMLVLDQAMTDGKKALEKLDNLIIAKAEMQRSAKGIKKLIAKAKTKSLGDLRETKTTLDKTFETVNRETLGIRMYFDKLDKK